MGDENKQHELLQSQQQRLRQRGEEVKVDGKPPRPPVSATTTASTAPAVSGALEGYINSKAQRLSLNKVQEQDQARAQVHVKESTIAMDPNFATADWDEDHTPLPIPRHPLKLASASAPQGPGITPDSNWLDEDFDK
jgi:hypothetical protein